MFPAVAAALTLFDVCSWVASLFLFVLVEGRGGLSLSVDVGIGADGQEGMGEAAGLTVGLTGQE